MFLFLIQRHYIMKNTSVKSSNEDISIFLGEGKTSNSGKTAPEAQVLSTNEGNSFLSIKCETSLVVTNAPVEEDVQKKRDRPKYSTTSKVQRLQVGVSVSTLITNFSIESYSNLG